MIVNVTIIVTLNSSKCDCNPTKFLPEWLKQVPKSKFSWGSTSQITQFCLIFSDHQQLEATNYWVPNTVNTSYQTCSIDKTANATFFFFFQKRKILHEWFILHAIYVLVVLRNSEKRLKMRSVHPKKNSCRGFHPKKKSMHKQ